MKHPLEILIKLKLMFTSYAELFNGSVTEKFMQSFWSPQKKKSAQTFPHNVCAVLCREIFFHVMTVSTELRITDLCRILFIHVYLHISRSVKE